MQSIERDNQIELIAKRKRARDSDVEVKIGPNLLRSEFDHVAGRIDTDDATVGDAACDFGGDSAVAASNVQHPIRTNEAPPQTDEVYFRRV